MNCKICNKQFKRISNTHLKQHNMSMQDYINKYGNIEDEDLKLKRNQSISNSLKGYKRTKEHQEKLNKHLKSSEHRKKTSKRMINNNPMKNKDNVQKMINTTKKRGHYNKASERLMLKWQNIDYRKKQSERLKYNNPMHNQETVIKNINAHNRLKSGYEELFELFLEDNLKQKITYTGNNKKWIDGKNPDYIIEDTNKVIEITSNFLNRTKDNYDKPRIKHFNKNGYQCLCIWIDPFPKYLYNKIKLELNDEIKKFIKNEYSKSWRYKKYEIR